MSILWRPWTTISAGIIKAGSTVTGIAWGNNVIVFSALSNGHVAQNAANPFADPIDWPNWAFTDGAAIPVPQIPEGAPVTAIGFGNQIALFAFDQDGSLWQNIGDPVAVNWNGWSRIALAISVPATPISAIAWGNSIAIFLVDLTGPKQNLGDPNQKNWGICTLIPGVSTVPGSNIAAVPWGNRVALFLTDNAGVVQQNIGDPQTNMWAGWNRVGTLTATPGAPLTVTPGAPVTAQIWGNNVVLVVTSTDGSVYQSVGDPNSAAWQAWTPLPALPVTAAAGSPVTAIPIGNQLAVFAAGGASGQSDYFVNLGYPQTDNWAGWVSVGQGGFAPGGTITAVAWTGGFPALFAADLNGAIWTTSPIIPPVAPTGLVLDGLTSADGEVVANLAWTDDLNTSADSPVSYSVVYRASAPPRPPISATIDNGPEKTLSLPVALRYTYAIYVEARKGAQVSGPSNTLQVHAPTKL